IWETRSDPRHYVYSKIMCWTALDRAIRLFGPHPRWAEERDGILRAVMKQGLHPKTGALGMAMGPDGPVGYDAALLLLPVLGAPLPEKTIRATVREIQKNL